MPKIKLKPNLHGVEIGIDNAVNLKFTPGEAVEVAEELLSELLSLGHFEIAKEKKTEKEEEGNE
ncbi:MAG TPA: hypothetical protein VGO50_20495 [Pyrinomonadaceae bacterium]|nr:hypothetical protein [Pyrinomonadaceae bacterium]